MYAVLTDIVSNYGKDIAHFFGGKTSSDTTTCYHFLPVDKLLGENTDLEPLKMPKPTLTWFFLSTIYMLNITHLY